MTEQQQDPPPLTIDEAVQAAWNIVEDTLRSVADEESPHDLAVHALESAVNAWLALRQAAGSGAAYRAELERRGQRIAELEGAIGGILLAVKDLGADYFPGRLMPLADAINEAGRVQSR